MNHLLCHTSATIWVIFYSGTHLQPWLKILAEIYTRYQSRQHCYLFVKWQRSVPPKSQHNISCNSHIRWEIQTEGRGGKGEYGESSYACKEKKKRRGRYLLLILLLIFFFFLFLFLLLLSCPSSFSSSPSSFPCNKKGKCPFKLLWIFFFQSK